MEENNEKEMKNILDVLHPPRCPKCGEPLVLVRQWNEDLFGKDEQTNPWYGWICRNENCRGWFCDVCDQWHPYGTSCSVALVRRVRDETDYIDKDPNWKHHV